MVPIVASVPSQKLLDGKVALIVGATGGIGFAIAKKYIESGCKVILAGTNENKLKKNASELGVDAFEIIDMNYINI